MRSVSFWALASVGLQMGTAGCSATAQTRVTNREFGFTAQFPAGTLVCESYSGEHLQGYYSSLNMKEPCNSSAYQRSNDGRYLSIVASYNSTFLRGMTGIVPDNCRPIPPAERRRLSAGDLRVAGGPSIACVIKGPHATSEIVVATRFGRWSDYFSNGPEAKAKQVNLLISLGTDSAHLERDLRVLRRFLTTVRVLPDKVRTKIR